LPETDEVDWSHDGHNLTSQDAALQSSTTTNGPFCVAAPSSDLVVMGADVGPAYKLVLANTTPWLPTT